MDSVFSIDKENVKWKFYGKFHLNLFTFCASLSTNYGDFLLEFYVTDLLRVLHVKCKKKSCF